MQDHSIDEAVEGTIGARVAHGYMIALARIVLGYAVAGVVFVLLSRKLPPSSYALYAGFSVAVPVLYQLVAQPLLVVLVRDQAELRLGKINAGFSMVLATLTSIAIISTMALGLGTDWDPLLLAGAGVYLVSLAFCFPAYTALSRNILTGRIALIELVDRSTFQVVTLVVVSLDLGIERALGCALLTTSAVAVLAHQVAWRWRPAIAHPRAIARELRSAVFPFAAILALLLGEAMLVPIVGVTASSHEAGLFGWAWSAAVIPLGFVGAAMQALFPALARIAERDIEPVLEQCVRVVATISLGICSLAAVLVPVLVPLLMPDIWLDAIPTFWVLIFAIGVHSVSGVIGLLWNARVSLRQYSTWFMYSMFVSCTLAVVGGWTLGAIGAAAAYAAGRLFLAALLFRAAERRFDTPIAVPASKQLIAAVLATAAGIAIIDQTSTHAALGTAAATAVTVTIFLVGSSLITPGAMWRDARTLRQLAWARPSDGGA